MTIGENEKRECCWEIPSDVILLRLITRIKIIRYKRTIKNVVLLAAIIVLGQWCAFRYPCQELWYVLLSRRVHRWGLTTNLRPLSLPTPTNTPERQAVSARTMYGTAIQCRFPLSRGITSYKCLGMYIQAVPSCDHAEATCF